MLQHACTDLQRWRPEAANSTTSSVLHRKFGETEDWQIRKACNCPLKLSCRVVLIFHIRWMRVAPVSQAALHQQRVVSIMVLVLSLVILALVLN